MIPNGGGGGITQGDLGAYVGDQVNLRANIPDFWNPNSPTPPTTGSVSPEQAQVISNVDQKLDAIVSGWVDSGGPGGYQQAVAHEILRRAALLQQNVNRSVRHWAKPGRERALAEMFSVLVQAVADRDRLLLELRERMNASPF